MKSHIHLPLAACPCHFFTAFFISRSSQRWQNRASFLAISAQLMRRVLVDQRRGLKGVVGSLSTHVVMSQPV
jgi:hypothetical protein